LSSLGPLLREYLLQVRDREGEVPEATGSGLREAEAFIPGNEFDVLGDDTHADDRDSGRSRFLEGMPEKCGAETPAALTREHTKPLDICQRG